MIERIEVRNFQSLYDVEVDLAKFTVIVGASSSGKSAFMRALRTLASNSRGTGFISHGQGQASITARGQDWVVTLDRGAVNGYKVSTPGGDEVFTKLGGAVPGRVSEVLGVGPVTDGSSLNFADQFDRPYLVAESGQTVARVLGELTNVSRIFEAVREANRRRIGVSGLLKTRKEDVAELLEQAQQYRGLADRQKALELASDALGAARGVASRVEELERSIGAWEAAEVSLSRTGDVPDVPDLGPVLEARDKLVAVQGAVRGWISGQGAAEEADLRYRESVEEEVRLKEQIHEVLVAAGQCPMCGQGIERES